MLTVTAPAKVNLYLYLSHKRDDGYHDLLTQVVFPQIGDELAIEASDLLTLKVTGEFAEEVATGENNLVIAAARALNKAGNTSHGAHITLIKRLPVGAGLGGGSADAAAALKALNAYWKLNFSFDQLLDIGLQLGADVPMCLHSVPLIAHGIGEVVMPIEKAEYQDAWMVLVHPRVVLLTKDVFANISEEVYARARFNHYPPVNTHPIDWWNDLQESAIQLCPVVAEVITAMADRALPGGQCVRMTGSGACVFGLFFEQTYAEDCFNKMQADFPHWWVRLAKVEL